MQQCDKRQDEFTSRDVEIISKESVFEGFFKMVKYRFKHKLFAGGWSDVVEREMFERGHAAAMRVGAQTQSRTKNPT
ncbi:ADP-ribose pyrophosphatase [Vibrio parahaemolyticus AQ3810]|nr:ADP-ribose pyrophosphatase [Vibrio parahaemolyticus AQ3810]